MLRKGLFLALALSLLSACDSSREPASQAPATSASSQSSTGAPAARAIDRAALAQRHAGRKLEVARVSEMQLDGASTLSVTFSVPLDPDQRFNDLLHLSDRESGALEGGWELADNLMELRQRHLPPQRELRLTVDSGLRAINGNTLGKAHEAGLTTADLQATVGFTSRGSLLPTRLADGLPVIALNVDQVNLEFFRIRPDALPRFLAEWDQGSNLSTWEAEQLLPLAELVWGGRFELKPQPNTREQLVLPMTGIKALQQPGVYLAVMRQAGTYTYSQPATLFTLSDIGVSVHRFRDQLDVFSQALDGGRALEGVELQLLDSEGNQLTRALSDARGHARLALGPKAHLLLATQNGQTSLLELNRAALDLGEFDITGPRDETQQLFVFGPRDLYRPGETVLLNALLRDRDGRTLQAQPLKVKVQQPDGKTLREFVWQPDEGGLYQYQLALDESLPTGLWQLQINPGSGEPRIHEFHVEDFLPERLALELQGSAQPLAVDAPPEFSIQARYLYGAPAAGNRLSGQLYVRPLRAAVPALPGFQFGDVTEQELSQTYELDEQKLDDEGQLLLTPDNSWSTARSPLKLVLQASVQESGGRPVTRRLEQPVWPAPRLPGVRGVFDGEQVDGNGMVDFELVLADAAGNKLAADNLTVRLVQERRDYYWWFNEGWDYRYNVTELVLDERPVSTPADGVARVSFPVDWGSYRVELVDNASGLRGSQRFWAGYRWEEGNNSDAVRPDRVKLALDKAAYRNGDVAKVTVTPPAAGKGYLLVESASGPLWWQPIEVPAAGATFDIPVASDWLRHDLYVSALVVRPGERKAQQTPRRAVGLLHLPLEREQRRLALTLDAPAKMRPNQPLQVKVQARNADGTPAAGARVLVSAVDVGILNITEFATPDPFAAFFGRKAYGADQLDVYGRLIEAGQGRLARLAFGGDAELDVAGKLPDSKVQIVAQQAQPLVLDASGSGEISLDIPDFNGELRLMAQAWNAERFGMAEGTTVVAAPLIAEASLPRFLAGGDETVLALDVSNQSGQPQQVSLTLSAEGQLVLTGSSSAQLTLADGQRRTLPVPVRALGGLGEGVLKVAIDGLQLPGERFGVQQRQWSLGVRPAWPGRVQQLRGVLKDAAPWQLPAGSLDFYAREGLQAKLSLSQRPPLDLAGQIEQLRAYPYGCLEQTTSGLYPALYADAATLARLGLQGDSDEERRAKIDKGIGRLLGMQQHRGGFGLWTADSEEEYWLTAYVTDFLLRAREQGFAVPDAALQKATARLLAYLQQGSLIDYASTEDAAHTRFAVQAYAGYVLARSQQAPLGSLRALFEQRSAARSGLPLLQLAAALKLMGDEPRAATALQEGLIASRSGTAWYGDYGSPLRDLALGYVLLQEQALADGQREQLLWSLAEALKSREWLSTQERNALFLAGRLVLGTPEQPWSAQLTAGAQSFSLDQDQPVLNLPLAALTPELSVTGHSAQPLYLQLSLGGYPAAQPKAEGNNLSIQREYLDMDGKPVDLRQLRSGDLVLVHLLVKARESVADALVVDLLPAGLELENQNLAQSAASLQEAAEQVRGWLTAMQESEWDSQHWLRHQEFRADRYVAAIRVDGYSDAHLLYLARAVTPGRYRVPPPQVESMYRPQWRAQGDAPALLEVQAR